MRSLDLFFITRHYKQVVLPKIKYANIGNNIYGIYFYPNKTIICAGEEIFTDKGLIIINSEFPQDHASTIAHEWRHHWQYHNGLLINSYSAEEDEPFRTLVQPEEADAHIFSHYYAPDDGTHMLNDCIQKYLPIYRARLSPSENAGRYKRQISLITLQNRNPESPPQFARISSASSTHKLGG